MVLIIHYSIFFQATNLQDEIEMRRQNFASSHVWCTLRFIASRTFACIQPSSFQPWDMPRCTMR
jgi:hypothetical protein